VFLIYKYLTNGKITGIIKQTKNKYYLQKNLKKNKGKNNFFSIKYFFHFLYNLDKYKDIFIFHLVFF